jgi:hypothetical protein
MLILGGCLHRYVDPPPPVDEGALFVHVVKGADESLPKILTWYTGTTLSQDIVLRFNPVLTQRAPKVGDRIVIPVELVANTNPYGTAPQAGQVKAPNLLMGEAAPVATPVPTPIAHTPTPQPARSSGAESLPALSLETFGDEMNPDGSEQVESSVPVPGQGEMPAQQEDKVKRLRQEIAEKQRELDSLQGNSPPAVGDEDMPPPGGLKEFEGS